MLFLNLWNSGRTPVPIVALLIGLVLSIATGCPKDYPPPENPIEDPQVLRNAIDARAEAFETARYKDVVLDYFGDGERVKVRQLLLIKRPASLRIQTRAPGSDELMNLLVSDGNTFAMHKRDTHEYFSGAASRKNIARLVPVDLTGRDLMRVMVASAPWDRFDEGGEPTLDWDRRKGHYRYSVETTNGKLTMWVRSTDYAVVEVKEENAQGDETYRYTTDDWTRYKAGALPNFRRFVWPARDLDFSLDVGETQVNVELPDLLFELAPPPGSTLVPLND